jgi:enoyl-CoA hydratase/carnithine racemase
MVLTSGGYRINAQRAYEIGLVSEVVPQDRLMSTATGIAEQVAECAPLAVRGSVEAIWRSLNMGTEDAMVLGRHIIQENWHTEDFTEGPRAFAERRKPDWKGR